MPNKINIERIKKLIDDITSEFTEFTSDLEDAGRVYDAIDALWEYVENMR